MLFRSEELQENVSSQNVTADFAGRVEDIQVEAGENVQNGTVLATLVDDSAMKTTLYFSYAYEEEIYTGMEVSVSVSDQMLVLTGTVTGIDYVNYVTPEGMSCFAVTVQVTNPGSLAEGMSATCWLTGADGGEIYAVGDGELEYNQEETITAGAAGELLGVYVTDYEEVQAGELLFSIDASSYESQLQSAQEQIEYYEERIADLQESIDTEYTRYADITGQVVYADYSTDRMTGEDSGTVMIYNQDSMEITVNIDELNVDYVEEGMEVTVYRTTSSSAEPVYYPATLTYLSLEATSSSSGVSIFEATITIDSEGELSSGVTVYYIIDTSGGSGESVLSPIDALCTYDDGYYLLVQSDSRPEETIDPEEEGGQRHRLPRRLLCRAGGGGGLQRELCPDPLRCGGGGHGVPPLSERGAVRRRHHLHRRHRGERRQRDARLQRRKHARLRWRKHAQLRRHGRRDAGRLSALD